MSTLPQKEITRLLADLSNGKLDTMHELMPVVYKELRQLAHRQLARAHPGETLNTTGLVHEAYLKLIGGSEITLNDRAHFFRLAAQAMRQIIVDHARAKQRAKRGGGQPDIRLDKVNLVADERVDEVLALDEALQGLAQLDPRQHQIVELRYFAGFTIPETGEALGISPATVKREWKAARAWLHYHIKQESAP